VNNSTADSAPSTMTNRLSIAGVGSYEIAIHDTNAGVSSFSSATVTSDIAVGAVTAVSEILDTGIAKSSGSKPVNPFAQTVIA